MFSTKFSKFFYQMFFRTRNNWVIVRISVITIKVSYDNLDQNQQSFYKMWEFTSKNLGICRKLKKLEFHWLFCNFNLEQNFSFELKAWI